MASVLPVFHVKWLSTPTSLGAQRLGPAVRIHDGPISVRLDLITDLQRCMKADRCLLVLLEVEALVDVQRTEKTEALAISFCVLGESIRDSPSYRAGTPSISSTLRPSNWMCGRTATLQSYQPISPVRGSTIDAGRP